MLQAACSVNAIALLLGGTYCSQEKDTREKSAQVDSDFRALKRALPVASVAVVKEIPFKPYSEKRETVSAIELFLDNSSSYFLIYWSGHGDLETGDWRFSDDRRLSLKEIIRLWKVHIF